MVKGVSRRVVVVKSPDPKWFEQAIFLLREEAGAEDAPEEQVFVLHTLVIAPEAAGRGYGRAFVAFYEDLARKNGCTELRMDTNERNLAARTLYHKLGYTEVDILPTVFNGISGVNLVLLEKYLGA